MEWFISVFSTYCYHCNKILQLYHVGHRRIEFVSGLGNVPKLLSPTATPLASTPISYDTPHTKFDVCFRWETLRMRTVWEGVLYVHIVSTHVHILALVKFVVSEFLPQGLLLFQGRSISVETELEEVYSKQPSGRTRVHITWDTVHCIRVLSTWFCCHPPNYPA